MIYAHTKYDAHTGKGAHELQHHAHAMTNNMNNVSSIFVQLVAEYHTGKKSAVP
jgi:hypothetical protein